MEKRVQDYSKEILKIIRSNTSPAVMAARLQDYHENDLAEVMPELTVQERYKMYRILDTDMLSDIFEYTDEENAVEYLNEMDVKKAAAILSRMETDALADVLNKVEKTKKKILYTSLIIGRIFSDRWDADITDFPLDTSTVSRTIGTHIAIR